MRKRAAKRKSSPAKAVSAAPQAEEEDLKKLTVPVLRAKCEEQGLDSKGTKPILIARLVGGATSDNDDDEATPSKVKKQSTIERAVSMIQKSSKGKKKTVHVVDERCPHSEMLSVVDDYDCMLNQTNIQHNNNKYYVIQLLLDDFDNYHTFNRWGRVGEPGAISFKQFESLELAEKDFCKKFKDKTNNEWAKRDKFKPVRGKYTLLEMGDEEEEESTSLAIPVGPSGTALVTLPSRLDAATQAFIKLIFDTDMFKEAMINLDIDVKKMPLGSLSQQQLVKGFQVLDKIKTELSKAKPAKNSLTSLSSEFYTVIPHSFGRQRPPIIADQDHLRKKLDMLITLGDIEIAQDMLKTKTMDQVSSEAEKPLHPLDENYQKLKCQLTLLKKGENEYQIIQKYLDSTKGQGVNNIINIWKVHRDEEASRFNKHAKVKNRKLLWHGTNAAVVAAILKSGLRIMPHSGGRVGRGIYFASENSKSAGYVCPAKKNGIMFLNEVALGQEYHISHDNSSLTAAPSGFDSVIADGGTEPDPKSVAVLKLDGQDVVVPQGKPIKYKTGTSFSQSEYLVYKESQNRIRYVLQLGWKY